MSSTADSLAILDSLAREKDPDVANFIFCLKGYLATGVDSLISRVVQPPGQQYTDIMVLGRSVGETYPWSPTEARLAEFAVKLGHSRLAVGGRKLDFSRLQIGLLRGVLERETSGLPAEGEELVRLLLGLGLTTNQLMDALYEGTSYFGFECWEDPSTRIRKETNHPTTLARHLFALPAPDVFAAVTYSRQLGFCLLKALAWSRFDETEKWVEEEVRRRGLVALGVGTINTLVSGNCRFDPVAIAFLTACREPESQITVLVWLLERRPETHTELFLRRARRTEIAASPLVMKRLCKLDPDVAVAMLAEVLRERAYAGRAHPTSYVEAYQLAAETYANGGAAVFEAADEIPDLSMVSYAFQHLLKHAPIQEKAKVVAHVRRNLPRLKAPDDAALYAEMAQSRPEWFEDEWWELLRSPSKQHRNHAVSALTTASGGRAVAGAITRLTQAKVEARLGAVALLGSVGGSAALNALENAWANEPFAPVRREIEASVRKLGGEISQISSEAFPLPTDFSALEAFLTRPERKLKALPEWFKTRSFPPLFTLGSASAVSPAGVGYLIETQSDAKYMDVAPAILALIKLIDRSRSGDFALALLDAWLGSDQETKHRWAMTIAGALGDKRILSVLNRWIPKWCEASRGKLAEYAAQAIALQGSDEALMLLDVIATRYRSKQRSIGAAAARAFQAAAAARGLSAGELGDVVVPAFAFDANGVRDFIWEGGAARAELGVDLKVSWSDPESDTALKGLPASAPDAVKTEVKELGKLLREAGKGQTARLELALVRQRRWPVARWRELYETHPVLRAYATRLVWGVYASDGALLRCFRRYPNGLLADAAGVLEELPEADVSVGMVHPLELAPATITAWRAHLARFKVTSPFPQLDRAVERLDPLHANRRELATAKDRAVGAGTFRSRAERRGWMRGSVIDGGGVAGYYKDFPGAGVEVCLELEGFYIGVDPMETVTLGAARFVRADTVKRSSYTYDDPQAGDHRVLAFGEVPPVVYSEAVRDLKAIAGIVASAEEGGDDA